MHEPFANLALHKILDHIMIHNVVVAGLGSIEYNASVSAYAHIPLAFFFLVALGMAIQTESDSSCAYDGDMQAPIESTTCSVVCCRSAVLVFVD